MKDYYEGLEDEAEYSFDDYIEEFGYNGKLYACFEEFYDNEYLDKSYIKQLFNNDKLFAEYENHLKQREFYLKIKPDWKDAIEECKRLLTEDGFELPIKD